MRIRTKYLLVPAILFFITCSPKGEQAMITLVTNKNIGDTITLSFLVSETSDKLIEVDLGGDIRKQYKIRSYMPSSKFNGILKDTMVKVYCKPGTLLLFGCNKNNITHLNVSNCKSLNELYCGYNELKSLDVSKNSNLKDLECRNNQLDSVFLRNNYVLERLWIQNNKLKTLDISNNAALHSLWCTNNQISDLKLERNKKLKALWCENNKLDKLDLDKCPNLQILECSGNHLTDVKLDNPNAFHFSN